jgi:lipopolysaccharide transport system permease protein
VTALVRSVRDAIRFRDLIALLVARDLKVRYKRSVLGMFWTLLNPLLQMIVYTLVFSVIMRVAVPQFPVFLLAGLLPWNVVAGAGAQAAYSVVNNGGLIRKVPVPQLVYPVSVVASKAVDLLLSLIPLAVIGIWLGRPPTLAWLALVPCLAILLLFAAGLALFFSTLTVFFRDMRHLVDILFQVWFYLTPIFYPLSFLEKLDQPWIRTTLGLNPATPIIRCFQAVLYEGAWPAPEVMGVAALQALVSFALGTWLFARNERSHILYV